MLTVQLQKELLDQWVAWCKVLFQLKHLNHNFSIILKFRSLLWIVKLTSVWMEEKVNSKSLIPSLKSTLKRERSSKELRKQLLKEKQKVEMMLKRMKLKASEIKLKSFKQLKILHSDKQKLWQLIQLRTFWRRNWENVGLHTKKN
mgnify:CR=1 FL=1